MVRGVVEGQLTVATLKQRLGIPSSRKSFLKDLLIEACKRKLVKIKRVKTRESQEDMAIVTVFTLDGEVDLLMFSKVYKIKAMDLFEEKTYIFKTTFSPARGSYGDTYIIDDFILGVNFVPTFITVTNPVSYNSKDINELQLLSDGKIPVYYSGYDLDVDRTEKIGYIDVFDVDYLKTIPTHLQVTVNVF